MYNPIVSRLMRSRKHVDILKESMLLYEADADDEYAALNDEDDDSHSPEIRPEEAEDTDNQPAPDSEDTSSSEEHIDDTDYESDDSEDAPPAENVPPSTTHSSGSGAPHSSDAGEEGEPELDTGEDSTESDPDDGNYINPLDNKYAVKFTLGDDVVMTYSNGTHSELKGTVDGYDPEGFYRIRWEGGLTTNGITDIALKDLVKSTKESRCVCGCTEFINESKYVVCDRCGRHIRENAQLLQLADESRPKGKKMIRSIPHEMSTAVRPNISETIKSALNSIKESSDEDDIDDVFENLESLRGEFWTRKEELSADIEELGYTVSEINDEYVVVESEDSDDALLIPISGTSRTMTLDFDKARNI